MPCRGPDSDPGYTERQLRGEVDKVTKLLCDVCEMLEEGKSTKLGATELGDWWRSHQKLDENRRNAAIAAKKMVKDLNKRELEKLKRRVKALEKSMKE